MPSTFRATDAANYERLMGRWSRRLAIPFIEHAGIADGESVLEAGCGTGSLTFALGRAARLAKLTAIDYADVYVAAVRARNEAVDVSIEQGDVCDLHFDDASFDRTLSLLVLHFVTQPERAVAEMRRVTRPGGTVAAAVWDAAGGMPSQRMFWDIAAMLDESALVARAKAFSRPGVRAGDLAALWREAGLVDIDDRSLFIRMDYASFDDYWSPFLGGEGGPAAFLSTLDARHRDTLEEHVRSAYLAGAGDGPRSFVAAAWSCRGTVPRLGVSQSTTGVFS